MAILPRKNSVTVLGQTAVDVRIAGVAYLFCTKGGIVLTVTEFARTM